MVEFIHLKKKILNTYYLIFEYNLELILSKKMFKKSTKIRVKIYGLFISFTLNLKIFIG